MARAVLTHREADAVITDNGQPLNSPGPTTASRDRRAVGSGCLPWPSAALPGSGGVSPAP